MGSDMLHIKQSKPGANSSEVDLIHCWINENNEHNVAADASSGCTTSIPAKHIGLAEEEDDSDSTVTPPNTPKRQDQDYFVSNKSSPQYSQQAAPTIALSLSQALIALPCHYALVVTHQLLDLVDHALERTGQGVEYAKGSSKNTRASLPKRLQESIQSFHALADQAIAMTPRCCWRSKQSR